jgi:hypothetical protein
MARIEGDIAVVWKGDLDLDGVASAAFRALDSQGLGTPCHGSSSFLSTVIDSFGAVAESVD